MCYEQDLLRAVSVQDNSKLRCMVDWPATRNHCVRPRFHAELVDIFNDDVQKQMDLRTNQLHIVDQIACLVHRSTLAQTALAHVGCLRLSTPRSHHVGMCGWGAITMTWINKNEGARRRKK